jgi:epsilon-lactone hydrolase
LDPSVSRERISNIARLYLAGKNPQAPLASPMYADLHGLPPLLVQVGAIETLLDDARTLAARAQAAGVKVELEVWDDMPHVWHHFAPILPADSWTQIFIYGGSRRIMQYMVVRSLRC